MIHFPHLRAIGVSKRRAAAESNTPKMLFLWKSVENRLNTNGGGYLMKVKQPPEWLGVAPYGKCPVVVDQLRGVTEVGLEPPANLLDPCHVHRRMQDTEVVQRGVGD